ncbi:MAG: hypothetical protein V7711_01415 [Pseudomonadales bacterium]
MENSMEAALTERQQYWLKHIRACDSAKQTSVDYARAQGINVKSLYAARKALAEKIRRPRSQQPQFQKVQVSAGQVHGDSQWHIQLPNGIAIRFGGQVDATTLSMVLSSAAALS